jgi:mannan endo-1,4-beta-mannosidase
MKTTIRLITVLVVLIVLFSCNRNTREYVDPVNPDATRKTKELYYFIQDIQGHYTLSGQHNFCGKGSAYTNQLEELTGKKAIVWGSDFSFCVEDSDAMRYQHCGPANLPAFSIDAWEKRDTMKPFVTPRVEFLNITLTEARDMMVEEAKKCHAQGHIITLMWHGCYPTDGDCCNGSSIWAMENRPSPDDWDSLVTEGTSLNNVWKESADKIAGYLKQLQEADIPVLWRPYHEMNGVWFWWCNQKGDQGFKRLWIMMYDYFTNTHKLNNLIWVWDANAPRQIPNDEAWAYDLFYPGNEYVDILAADVYRNDYKKSHYDQLIALGKGKPIALGEVGDIPTPGILKDQPQWTWYMPWGWILFAANSPDKIKELIHSEQVLTLDEISIDKQGVYSVRSK